MTQTNSCSIYKEKLQRIPTLVPRQSLSNERQYSYQILTKERIMKLSNNSRITTSPQGITKTVQARSSRHDDIKSLIRLQNDKRKHKKTYKSRTITETLSKTSSGKITTNPENSQEILVAKKEPIITGVVVSDFSYHDKIPYNFLQVKKLLASQGVNIVALVETHTPKKEKSNVAI